jgi:hypothetical protein
MRRYLRSAFVILTCLGIAPSLAYAQASLTGVVRDASGGVLPGVTVEASSPALIERVRSVVTDGGGQYRIEDLRPGAYTITFTLPGFATVRREGIELTGAFVATVNADMRVGDVEETITVTGETPLVDVQSGTRQRVLNQEIVDLLPSARTPATILQLLPGTTTTRPDVGGLTGDGTARGGNTTRGNGDVQTLVGGVTMQSATGGSGGYFVAPNMAAYQEVVVDTGGLGAERREGGVRINLIPRDGGNTFAGSLHSNFANRSMQGTNFTQDLKDRGLGTPNTVKKLYDINPSFGGPIKQDKLWFNWTVRYSGAAANVPMFFNKNAGNPNLWTYEPDTSRQWADNNYVRNHTNSRLTWQATPRNKVAFTYDVTRGCDCPRGATASRSPEAHMASYVTYDPKDRLTGEWKVPLTNRSLFETTLIRYHTGNTRPSDNLFVPPGLKFPQVMEQSAGLTYRGTAATMTTDDKALFGDAIWSYITGAHALKVGVNFGWASQDRLDFAPDAPMEFRFNNGVPNRITLRALPFRGVTKVGGDHGVFIQDRRTVDRLTLTLGLRYDYFHTLYPESRVGLVQFAPNRNIVLPKTDGVRWHHILPRTSMAFDVFGDGKTALKASLGKYLAQQAVVGEIVSDVAPVTRLVTSTTRSWNDANRNFVPDCDLLNPAVNGECGAMANPNFGGTQIGLTIDPDILHGWNKAPNYDWAFSVSVQRELLPQVSIEVSYWRTWYGNFLVTDDRALVPADFDAFRITAPADPRLPGGGGYAIPGLYDLKPAKFGVPAANVVTLASTFGKQIDHWNGVDVTFNARPRVEGLVLQGGLTTERRTTDNCDVVTKMDNPSPLYCHVQGTFLMQVKFLAAYRIPRIGVQVSGNLQNMTGPAISANYTATNAVVAPSLGRNLSGGAANVSVNLVEPRTMYGERRNQLDLRISRSLRAGRVRATPTVDVYNAFNSNPVLELNNSFATWLRPQGILPARFAKVGLQIDF